MKYKTIKEEADELIERMKQEIVWLCGEDFDPENISHLIIGAYALAEKDHIEKGIGNLLGEK